MTQINFAAAGALALVLATGTAAFAHGPTGHAAQASTANLQGDQQAWINDPHMHAFYELTRQAFAAGPARVDEAAYTKQAYDIFRAFGAAHGGKPEAMVDHLKLIPGQVVQIVKEDPQVLASYNNFVAATFGPQ